LTSVTWPLHRFAFSSFTPLTRSKGLPLRNRLGEQEDDLLVFFRDCVPIPSGRKKRYFCGSKRGFFETYKAWCKKNSSPFLSLITLTLFCELKHVGWKCFHRIRLRERVGLLKGTQYECETWKKHKALMDELRELEMTEPATPREVLFLIV
jgi:hypothetical protein